MSPERRGTRGGGSRTFILASIALVMLASACTRSTTAAGSASPTPSPQSPSVAATPSPREKPPALADARVQGTWLLEFKGSGKHKALIAMEPVCDKGACDVRAGTDPELRLKNRGTLYSTKAKGSFGATCSGDPISSVVDLALRVRRADEEGGGWVATLMEGTLRETVGPQEGCSAAKRTYRVKASPTNARIKGRNDLPAIVLIRPAPEPVSAGGPAPPVVGPNIVICTPWVDPVTGENGKTCE